ncbi:hypothetical protein, partial [Paraburkholderia sp. SIMBA_027]
MKVTEADKIKSDFKSSDVAGDTVAAKDSQGESQEKASQATSEDLKSDLVLNYDVQRTPETQI